MSSSLQAHAPSVPGCGVAFTVADRQPARVREPLPTKQQIEAISDADALEAIRDEIDRRIARIEADLDFRDGTVEWEGRAISALAVHRYTVNLISRRLKVVRTGKGPSPFAGLRGVKTVERERVECHELSWWLIDGDIEGPEPETLAECEEAIDKLTAALVALEADRADEISRFDPAARDEAWMAEANAGLKRGKAVRQPLFARRGHFRRAEKEAAQATRDLGRDRAFVEEARDFLPRDTFLTLWDRVDRRLAAQPETPIPGDEGSQSRSAPIPESN